MRTVGGKARVVSSAPFCFLEHVVAIKSTIFKAELQVADMNRHHYDTHALTLARHPSETDERLMVRIIAFALYADEALVFGRGLSTEDEPALWKKDLTGAIKLWIDVGQPDEKEIRKACGRAEEVVVLTYGGAVAEVWWDKNRHKLERLDNLCVLNLKQHESQALAALAARTMVLQASLQDGEILLTGEGEAINLHPQRFKSAGGASQ